jgi:large repetitive protein
MEGYGLGQPVSAGDGGSMSQASFRSPHGIALVERSQGIAITEDIYVSDSADNIIRRIDGGTGIVTTIAGPGTPGVLGDGGLAASANLNAPLALYNHENRSSYLHVADSGNYRIRRIDLSSGVITTVAGNGNWFPSGDGGPATAAGLSPWWITGDGTGNLYAGANSVVRKVDAAGIISTVAGTTGITGWGDDDVLSTQTFFAGVPLPGWDKVANRLVITDYTRLRQIFLTPATSAVLTAPASPFVLNAPVTLQATVSPANATGSVRFYQERLLLGSAPLIGGTASFNWTSPSPLGSFNLRAVYGGDATNNLSSSPNVPVTIAQGSTTTTIGSNVNPALPGQAVTFTAAVTPTLATGTVQFRDGATVLGAVTVSQGYTLLTVSSLAPGTHSITASYSGSAQYLASSSSAMTQIVKTLTTTALVSSPNPSSYGSPVTLRATVSPATATGTVQFFVSGAFGGTLAGSATVTAGVAQLTTTTIPGGPISLTAVYSGDANHASSSTSPAVNHTVNKANSTTTLAANPSQSRVGQTVTFTATVAPAAATGTVIFRNGSTQIGMATISGGQAVFSTAALPKGTHSIGAVYQGDGNYNTSQSAILSYRVR